MIKPLIALEHINFSVGRHNPKVILENINLEVMPNSIITIVGPNGGGKSTLLKILLGLIKPTSGTVNHHGNKHLKIGYLPQKLNCDRSFPITVKQLLKNCPNQENFAWLVENCDLGAILDSSIHTLSGGERQRAFLARAVMHGPELLVLDEPTQGTDINRQAQMYHLLSLIRDRFQCAILLVSHDLLIVMKNTDRVICLDKHIHCEGVPVNVITHPEFQNIFGHIIARNLQEEFAVYTHNTAECNKCEAAGFKFNEDDLPPAHAHQHPNFSLSGSEVDALYEQHKTVEDVEQELSHSLNPSAEQQTEPQTEQQSAQTSQPQSAQSSNPNLTRTFSQTTINNSQDKE